MINISEIRDKLYDKLVKKGWDTKLRFFLRSSEFEDLILDLYTEVQEGRRFTPGLQDIFNCLEYTPLFDLKVVFVVPEPYTNPLLNTGLAIATRDVNYTPQYRAFLLQLQKYVGNCNCTGGDLVPVAKQGVLFLNSSLTAQIQTPGKHTFIWENFTAAVFDTINQRDDIIWVYFGSCKFDNIVKNSTHTKLYVPELPSEKNVVWEAQDIFARIDDLLAKKNISKLIW